MLFTENEWYLINNIILEIHQSQEDRAMRDGFLKRIRFLIPYEKANFFLSSGEDEHYISDSVDIGFSENYLCNYWGNLEKHDFTNWIYASGQNEVFLLSELLSAQEQKENIYFRNYFLPNNIEYAAILSLSWEGTHVGTVSLFRSRSAGNFTVRDKQALSLFKNHLALRLHRSIAGEAQTTGYSQKNIQNIIQLYQLTTRESEILTLLLNGDELPAICQSLFISNNTLRKHISNIYKKIGINKRSDLNKVLSEL